MFVNFCLYFSLMLSYTTPIIQLLNHPILNQAGVQVLVWREDMNHQFISGNKWWKLKYNLMEAQRLGHDTLLTFGGAYSNHIYAVAAAAREAGFKSIGIIRGEETLPLNNTLLFAEACGMKLHYVSRTTYRTKATPDFIEALQKQFGNFYLIPEGGTNVFAVQGCEELGQNLLTVDFDTLYLPVGTGGTIAGIIKALNNQRNVMGVSVLKGDFHVQDIKTLLQDYNQKKNVQHVYGNWYVATSYHHGGYAKVTPELIQFIQKMNDKHNLPLDPVYTGKMMWAVLEDVKKGLYTRGTTLLALHTGGLQGASAILNAYEKNSTKPF